MWYSSTPAVIVPWRFRSRIDLTHVFWLSLQGKQEMSGWRSWCECLLFAQSPNFWSTYSSPRRLEVLQGTPTWTQPKRPEHPGILLFCFCYLSVFGPKSDKIEGKHKAAFVLPALQVTAFSNYTFRCITQSKEIMFLEITVWTLVENTNKNRNKSKLKQRHIWSKFDIYKSWTSDLGLTGPYWSSRQKSLSLWSNWDKKY